MKLLYEKVMHAQGHYRAQGTIANHKTAIKSYLSFCTYWNLDPITIDTFHACAFVEYIAGYLESPKSILNYVSGVKQYLIRRGASDSPFFLNMGPE